MPAEQPQWILDARKCVGDRVRVARIQADLTQERLAQDAGIDRSTLQRIEAGSHDTRISQLLRLARVLHMPARDLLP